MDAVSVSSASDSDAVSVSSDCDTADDELVRIVDAELLTELRAQHEAVDARAWAVDDGVMLDADIDDSALSTWWSLGLPMVLVKLIALTRSVVLVLL